MVGISRSRPSPQPARSVVARSASRHAEVVHNGRLGVPDEGKQAQLRSAELVVTDAQNNHGGRVRALRGVAPGAQRVPPSGHMCLHRRGPAIEAVAQCFPRRDEECVRPADTAAFGAGWRRSCGALFRRPCGRRLRGNVERRAAHRRCVLPHRLDVLLTLQANIP